MNIIRPKAAAEKCGVVPITIARWSSDPAYAHMKFPRKISLGDNSVGFIEEEINDWLAARADKRDADEEDAERPP